ncbi:MAG: hypothetical protein J6W75_01920 [Bacteroidaceae bacterium]|nr:hypothetical protein [Bacteroidaceae bacterium]
MWVLVAFLLLIVPLHSQPSYAQNQKTVRMGVVLPLKEKNSRGAKMVEFYQGMLLAVDSLKREGLNIEVNTFHSGTTAHEMDVLVNSKSLAHCDVVFGPLEVAQLPSLADYCDIHNVRLVCPFSPLATQVASHPRYYMATAPRATIQREAVWYIKDQFAEHNIILVDCNEQNEEGMAFGEQLRSGMSEKGVYVRQLNINADEISFQQAFNPLRKNLVVLKSTSVKALNTFLPKLKDYKRLHPELAISLFGYPNWQTYTEQLLNDFYELDTYIYTTFYRNPLASRTQEIDRTFAQWFHHPMQATFPRYGLMGFDLTYFFLRGLSIYGDHLEDNLSQVPSYPFQTPFWFERQGNNDGFINTFVELVHYTPLQTIELISRNR